MDMVRLRALRPSLSINTDWAQARGRMDALITMLEEIDEPEQELFLCCSYKKNDAVSSVVGAIQCEVANNGISGADHARLEAFVFEHSSNGCTPWVLGAASASILGAILFDCAGRTFQENARVCSEQQAHGAACEAPCSTFFARSAFGLSSCCCWTCAALTIFYGKRCSNPTLKKIVSEKPYELVMSYDADSGMQSVVSPYCKEFK
ncbi:hypothetical protein CVU75_02290 [Candidatus Dependentiae bacterium HGW-Dependentiae-1]|nr:MAG: hypothetical protein CVU75_02290 [Candidatus Dependentiae bacterium HGW-Dependentiae-1]